ncbi:MAG: hypothetical protein AYK22_03955 [Thermoplasmatales archaeon SG8-52-3]|nr:MAG: hypothetical protein AYK22_03955 [Thermoplasmatales archaeon SG8-52-3]
MVRGLATDSKRYKHIDRNDTKWLSKDLQDIKKTIEHYIDNIRPNENKTEKKEDKERITLERYFAILVLGIFGSITLVTGIFLLIRGVYFLGGSLSIFGAVFLLAFILFERFR